MYSARGCLLGYHDCGAQALIVHSRGSQGIVFKQRRLHRKKCIIAFCQETRLKILKKLEGAPVGSVQKLERKQQGLRVFN